MSRLLMLAAAQAAAYGPVTPSPGSASVEKTPAGKGCERAATDEIVVCKKSVPGPSQVLPSLSLPPSDQRLTIDPDGLFRLKLGKKGELRGGGVNGGCCVTIGIRF